MDGATDSSDAVPGLVSAKCTARWSCKEDLQGAGWREQRYKARDVAAIVSKAFLERGILLAVANTTIA